MAVPDFQTWFMLLLRRPGDGECHNLSDPYDELADDLELTDADRGKILPGGKQTTQKNRNGWAII